jgi:hypothetical protein
MLFIFVFVKINMLLKQLKRMGVNASNFQKSKSPDYFNYKCSIYN